VVGAYIAATIVALVQYLRLRDRRLLPIVALFAFQAQALAREWFDVWKDVFQTAACLAGLLMVVVLTLRPATATPTRSRSPELSPEQPATAAKSKETALATTKSGEN
jgi:hypothetical protein